MAETYGIKETVDVFDLGVSVVEGVRAAKAGDGKVDLKTDFVHFLNVPVKLFTAVLGADKIPKELADLDSGEIDQLREKFGDIVDDPKWQRLFVNLVNTADSIVELVKDDEPVTV